MTNNAYVLNTLRIKYKERIAEIQEVYEEEAVKDPTKKAQLAQELVKYNGIVEGLRLAIEVLKRKN